MAERRLAAMRADHWKRAGDEALGRGEGARARELYGRCLEAHGAPGGSPAGEPRGARELWEGEAVVRSNRSLALCRAGRFEEALADAERAAELRPQWVKAHWRRQAALRGLGRFREAIGALRAAWAAGEEGRGPETARALRQVVSRLTRRELGAEVQSGIDALQAAGAVPPPRVEAVSPEEMAEAWFRVVKDEHEEELCRLADRGSPSALPAGGGVYCRKVLRWCQEPMTAAEALLERARCNNRAACYLQARADARAALKAGGNSVDPAFRAEALVQLGASFMCGTVDEVHEDQDKMEGVKAIARAADLRPEDERISLALMNAGARLTQEEMSEVLQGLYCTESLEGGRAATEDQDPDAPPQRAFCVVARACFGGEASLGRFGGRAREILRAAVAEAAGLPKIRVVIAGASMEEAAEEGGPPVLAVRLRIHTGPDVLRAKELQKTIAGGGARAGAALGRSELEVLLGPVLQDLAQAEIEDATPRATVKVGADAGCSSGAESEEDADGGALALPARPKTDLELPYRMYTLVRSDGGEVERKNKHAFQFSRIHYDRSALDENVFVQPGGGACRWRQSSSEVVVIVPGARRGEVLPRDLEVTFETYRLTVSHRRTGEVYLEGQLERGVVAEDCVWDLEGGDHGLVLYLRKMNLELLSQPGSHGESWWPRLFRHHGEIAWDDYDKDYSDLPEPVMAMHLLREGQTQATNQLESAEKTQREVLQERDDVRRRRRQERLHVLRTGAYKNWVELDRANPPAYAFQAQQQLADRFGK